MKERDKSIGQKYLCVDKSEVEIEGQRYRPKERTHRGPCCNETLNCTHVIECATVFLLKGHQVVDGAHDVTKRSKEVSNGQERDDTTRACTNIPPPAYKNNLIELPGKPVETCGE